MTAGETHPWLRGVELRQYSELVARRRSPVAAPGVCGALPARALAYYHPLGCLRRGGHQHGPHSAEPLAAAQLDRREAAEARQ